MKNHITLIIILIGLSGYSQTEMTDWKEMNGKTTLKNYMENQAYEYLNFKLAEKDSLTDNGVRISHGSTNSKIIIRDQNISYAPLIVIINR